MPLLLCDGSSGINQVLLSQNTGKAVALMRKVGRNCLGGHRGEDGVPGDVGSGHTGTGWGQAVDLFQPQWFCDANGAAHSPTGTAMHCRRTGVEVGATGQSPSRSRGNGAALSVTHGIITFNTEALNIERQLNTR